MAKFIFLGGTFLAKGPVTITDKKTGEAETFASWEDWQIHMSIKFLKAYSKAERERPGACRMLRGKKVLLSSLIFDIKWQLHTKHGYSVEEINSFINN